MTFSLHYAAASDIGLGRYKNNQDSGYAGPHLLVVADGMGGAAGGDIASSTVIGELVTLDSEGPGPDASRDLVNGIRHANDVMQEQVQADPSLQGMGSTCTAMLRTGHQLVLAHVGDSRAYLLADGVMTQLTRDHTFVQRLIDTGQITEEEAERHPQRSVILRVVGHMEGDEVDVKVLTPKPGQRLLLCSDGLPRVVTDDTISDALMEGDPPQETADRLVQLALRAGGPDNITVIVADVVGPNSAPPLTPEVVGAAASVRNIPTAATGSAAARAAALTASRNPDDSDEGEDDGDARRPGWVRPTIATLCVLALVAAGLFGVNRWRQTQYYVGVKDGKVALFQGLNTQLGPLHLSKSVDVTALRIEDLQSTHQASVTNGTSGPSKLKAQETIKMLWQQSKVCNPTDASSTTSPATGATPTSTRSTISTAPTASGTPKDPAQGPTPTGTSSPATIGSTRPECNP